jgi:hypothetical protein
VLGGLAIAIEDICVNSSVGIAPFRPVGTVAFLGRKFGAS